MPKVSVSYKDPRLDTTRKSFEKAAAFQRGTGKALGVKGSSVPVLSSDVGGFKWSCMGDDNLTVETVRDTLRDNSPSSATVEVNHLEDGNFACSVDVA